MLAIVVDVPDTYGSIGTPTAASRRIGRTPMADTPLLLGRNDGEILIDNPFIIVGHALMHLLGHIAGTYGITVLVVHSHVKL